MNIEDAYLSGLKKVRYLKEKLGTDFPHITKNGVWLTNSNGHWTGGFWIGLLWLAYLQEKESSLLEEIHQEIQRLAGRMQDSKTHDMGFIFGPSCIMGHHIEPNSSYLKMAEAGAHNMEKLYRPKIGLIQAWDEPGYQGIAIVDTIMNLPIMLWYAQKQKDEKYRDIAIRVAQHIQKYHVREDYSTYHMVKWETGSPRITKRYTHQGFRADTCWSRGQAWALYGFANMYRYTSRQEFMETAENLAAYFWDNLDDTRLPKWDFYFKNDLQEPVDASAASIAASGMLLLSGLYKQSGEEKKALLWEERGREILDALMENCFFKCLDKYGIIEKVTVDKPRNSGIMESSMYGDYYFMEALYRLIHIRDIHAVEILY